MIALKTSVVAAAMFGVAGGAGAEEFACTHDQCMDKMNIVLRKSAPQFVAAKQSCADEGGGRRCRYRSNSGPGVNMISKGGSPNVQAIVIVDRRGMTPPGGIYIDAIMQAFDTSLDASGRKQFYNNLLGDFASSFEKGGIMQKSSGKLRYVLSTDEKFTIIGVSHAK